ncbi:MAG TPA: hypothetical protein PKE39_04290 [Ignavibacteria bacterium]|nr:hypothetical protein [Ignavibacteria bacterium]
MKNEEIIELIKATITTGTGGQVSPQELSAFIDTMVDENDFLSEISVETDISGTLNMDALDADTRGLTGVTEDTDITDLNVVSIPRRTLTPVEVARPFDISMKFLRKNIEKGGAEQTITSKFMGLFSRDVVDLAWNGDKAEVGDPFLKLVDGYIVRAKADDNTNKLDGGFVENDKITDVLDAIWDTLPDKYKADPQSLKFYLSFANYTKYRRELTGKATGLGDMLSTQPLVSNGVNCRPLFAVPSTEIVLCNPKNLHVGFGLNMYIGRQVQERKKGGIIEYTPKAEIDANYGYSKSLVIATRN